jgi:aspartyl protease family protein
LILNRLLWVLLAVIAVAALLLIFNNAAGRTLGIENEDFSRLVWFALFGVVIGAGLLRSGRSVGTLARQFGGWVLIVLALIAGYQYRYELQDFASRVTAGLVPGSPLALGTEDGRPTVTLDKADNGHFEARIEVNGKPVRAVVDTGATSTVLTAEDARAAGIDADLLRYTVPVSTANGATKAAAVRVSEIGIGGIVRRDKTILVAAPGTLATSLLGMDFIGSLSGFDVRGDRMILRD